MFEISNALSSLEVTYDRTFMMMMTRYATICMMIMTLFTIFSLSDLASLTTRKIAQTKTMQEATSDSCAMS